MWYKELKEENRITENRVEVEKRAGQENHANIFR